ncbi:FAD-linked oxidoreductase phmC [Psilocybe cubensis]|uniref:FAD-linked oxidoreductase phmC n=1 Tax=Psilocybe cubensis TaxID=181762 RepID=A0ACB8H316_PSICU|nr:FAD-linked oxidoreductase phmC [Psilocybe cubensis]KAH9482115.1 FAD-linked oxidoreductase phmC [Psilocybe cubensis]
MSATDVLSTFTARSNAFSIDPSEWAFLNATLGGRLMQAIPVAQPCFSQGGGSNQTAFSDLQTHNEDHIFRSNHFGAYENTNWETCQSTGDECLLDWTDPTNPTAFATPQKCLLGNIPSYYYMKIDISGPNDVKAAFNFANQTGIRLSIKNTGLTLNETFIPDGCSASESGMTAITIGAGQQFRTIYNFAKSNNITVVGGADPAVGASGGWVMGGGHSALSVTMGLGVDRVLEFKIVTPDGQYRTANRCQNQDLFFALRGGGGGTFGVVLESTHMASPRVTIQAQPPAGAAFWANPVLNATEAKHSASGMVDAFASVNGTTTFFTLDSFSDFYDMFIDQQPDPVGRPQVIGTRLIPSDKFDDDILIEAIISGMLDSDFSQITAVTPFSFKKFNGNDTSINPAWRTAIWQTVLSYAWNFNSTLEDRVGSYNKVTQGMSIIRERTLDAAVYFNEADVYEPDYINAFWGEDNYKKLLAIKQK